MKILKAVLPYVLIAAILALLFFFPAEKAPEDKKTIVEVWNVDTFEGGTGSRTAFLNRTAQRAAAEGVYYYVLNYTAEGATVALKEGKRPDMISYGLGFGDLLSEAVALPYSFAGGEAGGKCLAVPWCMGKYFLFSLTNDFTETGKTAVSCGGENLSVLAARLEGIEGEERDATSAYVAFLNGDYRYLFGTQRDARRFLSRGVTVYAKEMTAYNDLYQYASVLSAEKKGECMRLLDELLSEQTRQELDKLGMYPPLEAERTASVFSSRAALSELASLARTGTERKILEKYLKSH